MMLPARRFLWIIAIIVLSTTTARTWGQRTAKPRPNRTRPTPAKAEVRVQSVRDLLVHLGVGQGATIADIGAGDGRDTWVFAQAVGATGAVYAEEIAQDKVDALKEQAEKKGLPQVHAVLGRGDDPCLPPESVDLVFMHYVYHHFAKPREMLRGIWRGLKPGGRLVVADRHRGVLRDWVERELRAKKHFFIAETTVVREAREEGFAFVGFAEKPWQLKDDFVLVFARPKSEASPGHDPDPRLPLDMDRAVAAVLPVNQPYQRPVIIALGEARQLMGPILQHSSGDGVEIVLEEWATQKDERPPLPAGVSLPSVLSEHNSPPLGSAPIDVVFFLDTYDLLFNSKALLAKLRDAMTPTGCIYVLDRQADTPLSRREASHRRQIQPETVKQEMADAGLYLWFSGPELAPDRFLLVFGKNHPEEIAPRDDPFVGGPTIHEPPGVWLGRNGWRLRGLRTTGGQLVRWTGPQPVQRLADLPSGTQRWKLPQEDLVLSFRHRGSTYRLTDSGQE